MEAKMSEWRITPFHGLGPLTFGMAREQARSELGGNFRTFRKTPKAVTDTDAYTALNLHLYYDENYQLNFVEVISGAPFCLRLESVNLFSGSYEEVGKSIEALGHSVVWDPDGPFFPDLGISFYAPHGPKLEAVGLFDRKQFDNYLKLVREIAERRRMRQERRGD